jgi:putative membrane protein
MAKITYLSEADHQRVSAAVAKAEAQTAGEIVTIVADRSDDYNDISLAWAAAIAFLAIAVFTAIPDFYLGLIDRVLGNWSHDWTQREMLAVALGIGVLKFIGMVLIQLWQPLKFFLVPGQIKTARALGRAAGFFKVGAERRTHGRTGIVIYLSMREHRADILADQAIAERVEAEVWGDAMAALLGHIKDGRVADGMIAAVEEVGKVLAEHFPRAQDDQNELPDRLIEI